MCGICGEIRFDGSQPSLESLEAMNALMVPRGPDGGGIHLMNNLAVGHRRLKIIDLSEHAQQPMVDNALGLGIVFNGCIYNYKPLRADLRSLGYQFFSEGDTEVILKAYHAWGIECVDRFHGMFAFHHTRRWLERSPLLLDERLQGGYGYRYCLLPLPLVSHRGGQCRKARLPQTCRSNRRTRQGSYPVAE